MEKDLNRLRAKLKPNVSGEHEKQHLVFESKHNIISSVCPSLHQLDGVLSFGTVLR